MPVVSINLDLPNFKGVYNFELDPNLPNELTILNYLKNQRLYETDISYLFAKTLKEGDCIIDVGANVGFFTALAALMVGPSGRVLGFEPDDENRKRLAYNLEINQIKNTALFENPVSNTIETVEFYFNSDDSGGHALWDPALFESNTNSQAHQIHKSVETTTLSKIAKSENLDRIKLIKVDTEGADQLVLDGARDLLQNAAVPFVVAELHEFGLTKMGCSQESFRDLMASYGYSTFALSYDGHLPKLIPPNTMLGSKYIINVLFSTLDHLAEYWPVEEIQPLNYK